MRREAEAAGIPIQVESRIKHFYSIYRKMKKKGRALDEIYDLVGMRLLCDTTGQCYELLGLVHSLWMPIEGRFKDYIAMPKSNLYQSLHTTVMGHEGKMLEIQIRTQAMHRTAEEGIAAHWLYKPDAAGRAIKAEQLTDHQHAEELGLQRGRLAGISGRDQARAAQGLDLRVHPQGGRDRAAQGGHRPSTSPTTSTPRWATTAGAPRPTGAIMPAQGGAKPTPRSSRSSPPRTRIRT